MEVLPILAGVPMESCWLSAALAEEVAGEPEEAVQGMEKGMNGSSTWIRKAPSRSESQA
jgi:hypothetical protein